MRFCEAGSLDRYGLPWIAGARKGIEQTSKALALYGISLFAFSSYPEGYPTLCDAAPEPPPIDRLKVGEFPKRIEPF